jgi:hypothetical protein
MIMNAIHPNSYWLDGTVHQFVEKPTVVDANASTAIEVTKDEAESVNKASEQDNCQPMATDAEQSRWARDTARKEHAASEIGRRKLARKRQLAKAARKARKENRR